MGGRFSFLFRSLLEFEVRLPAATPEAKKIEWKCLQEKSPPLHGLIVFFLFFCLPVFSFSFVVFGFSFFLVDVFELLTFWCSHHYLLVGVFFVASMALAVFCTYVKGTDSSGLEKGK